MKSILVVCEGNICRSPMAQGLLRSALPAVRVQSAGLGALVGMPADVQATQLMQLRGIDISDHRAMQITRQLCVDAELILGMDLEQRARIEAMYPQTKGRVFRIGEHTRQDIPDPYRQGEATFRHALELIDQGLAEWLARISKL